MGKDYRVSEKDDMSNKNLRTIIAVKKRLDHQLRTEQ